MPPLHLRQEFPSLKAFKEALHAWAIEAHFEPRILKSDTGRVRVGCKRDPNCPFVIRCNWERKQGVPPLARVTVMRDKHTCLNGLEWLNAAGASNLGLAPQNGNLEIRQNGEGNIVGGVRVLGPAEGRRGEQMVVPVLPKVQRNSASRLPFLMEILPRLMQVTKETTPVEIRECLLRKYGAEVHLQQCRRAKTEILKRSEAGEEGVEPHQQQQVLSQPLGNGQEMRGQQQQRSLDGLSEGDANQQLFGDLNATANQSPFTMHSASAVATPVVPSRSTSTLQTQGEAPVRCPYCINQRWMKSIKDAVDHMSMHVVV